jgi:hypothetical protein
LEAILLAIVQDRAHRDDERVVAEHSYPVREVCVMGWRKRQSKPPVEELGSMR